MDTDELSTETYDGIIIEAEKFYHDLTLYFGLMASDCKNETEYLSKAKKLIKDISKLNKEELTDLFFGKPPVKKELLITLQKILNNIEEIELIQVKHRHYGN